ncbi:unnamed protein product, partial [Sphacelaria rigidula]
GKTARVGVGPWLPPRGACAVCYCCCCGFTCPPPPPPVAVGVFFSSVFPKMTFVPTLEISCIIRAGSARFSGFRSAITGYNRRGCGASCRRQFLLSLQTHLLVLWSGPALLINLPDSSPQFRHLTSDIVHKFR